MTKTSVAALDLIASLSAVLLLLGLTGCIGGRYSQNTGPGSSGQLTAEQGNNQKTDQRIEDSRTAERVREALAAGADYKYEGVKVAADSGVVQLTGVVNTSAQRNTAEAVASKVVGVKRVENNLTVKN